MPISDWYDLHCHLLPGMDDGCRNEEESCQMLIKQREQGVTGIAATPHYYPRESVEQFLVRRDAAYRRLRTAVEQQDIEMPSVCLGAEVAFRDGISSECELHALCYGSSNYMLLEMPFHKWEEHVLREVERIRFVRGIIPVIAHFERYMKYQDRKTLNRLCDLDVLIQMNTEYYLDFWSRGKAKRMIRGNMIQVLGSDAHNLDQRRPNLMEAIHKMESDGLHQELAEMQDFGCKIFTAAME